MKPNNNFVTWFRSVAPYVNVFHGRTFVVVFSGEVIADEKPAELFHDFNVLASLCVRLVLVHGAPPQIDSRLKERKLHPEYVKGARVTDALTLQFVKETIGRVRFEIEALLSMELSNPPIANSAVRIANGNFITAHPIGVEDGMDLMYSKVRKVDAESIR